MENQDTDDERVAAFLELVNCEPGDVLDTAARHDGLAAAAAESSRPEKWVVPFGKHKGVEIGDVPDGYLLWAAEQRDVRKGFRKLQDRARAELERREAELDREYWAILSNA